MVTMVNFALCVFYHNNEKRSQDREGGQGKLSATTLEDQFPQGEGAAATPSSP
jgi:hypothetical protein